MRETGLNGTLTLSLPPLRSSPVPRFLRTGRGTERRQVDRLKKKVPVRDVRGFTLFLWRLGSCTWSLMQLVETGDLLRVCLDVESPCLWVAAL